MKLMYNVSSNIDKNKVFIVRRSNLENRIDPYFFKAEFRELRDKLLNNGCIRIGSLIKSWNRGDGPRDGYYTDNKDEGVYFLRVNNLKNHSIVLKNIKYLNREIHNTKLRRTQVKGGDLIFAISGTKDNLGTVSVIPDSIQEANLNSALVRLDLDTQLINKRFFCILFDLPFIRTQIEFIGKGAAQNNLNNEEISSILIPKLSLKEQKDIVTIYDFSFKENTQKKKEAKSLLESIDKYLLSELGIDLPERDNSFSNRVFEVKWSELFGDRLDSEFSQVYFREISKSLINGKHSGIKLKDVTSFIESGSRPKGGVGQIKSGIFSIGGEHVNDKCQVGNGKPKYIPLEFHEKIKLTETKMHDIVLVKDGATTGKIGIIDSQDFVNQNVNEHVFLIRPEETIISPHYLVSFLYSSIGQILLKRFITGATVTGLTKESLRNILIPLPPLDVQKRITEHIFELREKAKQLESEAKFVLKEAKSKIEKMIIG